MTHSRNRILAIGFGGLGVALLAGSAIWLLAAGTQPGAAFVFVLLAVVVLVVTLWLLGHTAAALLFSPQSDEVKVATGRRKKELEREKQALLKALKELQFDHEMQKISSRDYEEIAGRYRARAVRVMRQLDEGASDYHKLVERDVAARLAERLQPAEKA